MGSKDFIKTEGLTKKFGDVVAVDNISLSIPEGSYFGIIGLSGSGKTTLMNMMIGFWKPTKGRIMYNGKEVHKNLKLIDREFGFATQATSVYPFLTVAENLDYFGRLYGMKNSDIHKRTKVLLDLIHMTGTENLLAKELSTGMSRRLDIACSLIHSPRVLLLDEPTEDLDPVLRKELLALNKKINDEGTTIIMTSHMLDEVEAVCDRVAIIHNGKVIEVDSPDGLKSKYSQNEEIHLVTTPGKYEVLAKLFKRLPVSNIIVKSKKIVLYTRDSEKVLYDILRILNSSKERLIDLRVNKPTMEEVFEYITKR